MLSINQKLQKLAPFVDLRSDAGFKAVLADRDNKDILIGVLNLILPPEARVEDIVEYSDCEQRRDLVYGKKTVLDLVCVDQKGRTFIVEMQANPEERLLRLRALPPGVVGRGWVRGSAPGLCDILPEFPSEA